MAVGKSRHCWDCHKFKDCWGGKEKVAAEILQKGCEKFNGFTQKFTFPTRLDDNNTLLKVRTYEENHVHQSWLVYGNVIVYEDIPQNKPSSILVVFDNLKEYMDTVEHVYWLNDTDYIAHYDKDILSVFGFPFGPDPFYFVPFEEHLK